MIIILAAVVILTISKNNPIESAKEASFKEDVRTFQDELAMYIAKDYTSKAGARDEKITATNYNPVGDPKSVYTYIPSFSKKYEGKFVIKNDELMYSEGKLTDDEQKWSNSLNVKENIKEKTGAKKVAESPIEDYYGKEVNYTAPNGVNKWKIFYSDGSNVYLISSEYVNPVVQSPAQPQLPSKNNVSLDQGDATNFPKAARFNNILVKYSGSANITDEKMKAFNSDYFKERVKAETGETYVFSSTNNNMKAVAYMLDKEIWSALYANSSAEYAVGGPSIEMLMKSYCITHSDKKDLYKTQASSATGYQVSNNGGGTSYANYISGMLSTSEDLYVLPQNKGANAMWLASPSAGNSNRVMRVSYDGRVGYDYYTRADVGFRPLVCLNSNILLNWNDQTQKYDIE